MNIAIIDDQEDIQYAVEKILKREGHTCYGFYGNEEDLIDAFKVFDIDLIIIDMMLEKSLTGLNVIQNLKEHNFNIPTVMITAYTTPSNLIEASKAGITDIIQKPFSAADIIEVVNRYRDDSKVNRLSLLQDDEEFIGSFETMKEVYKNIGIASNSSENLFIYGKTGTGKDLVAKLVHKNSQRANEPFVAVNCSTIPENLFEKLMFGRVENYFKKEASKHIGYVQQCGRGTLYLDGVCNLTPQSQLKLLRFLETKSYYPLGASQELHFKGRVITSSTKTPKELLEDSNFTNDLYYRIATLEIALPSLNERKNDIRKLANHFIRVYNKECNLNYKGIEESAIKILENHTFNGNIRELKNIIYRAMNTSSKSTITAITLQKILEKKLENNLLKEFCIQLVEEYETQNLDKLFHDLEKEIITILLQKYHNISKVSKLLKVSRNTLKDKIRRYGILLDENA